MIKYWYPETLKNITDSLMERFSYMQVYRFAKDQQTIVKIIDVPIAFAPVEKTQQDRLEDYTAEPQSLGQRYYLQVPRLALTFNGMLYAPDRATGVNDDRYFANNTQENQPVNSMFKDSQPTPYNFTYTLYIRTDSVSDFSQIIENILPYFNPKLYLRVKEFSFLNVERDLSVILNDVNPDFTDELDKNSMRQINGSITFTVEGWMYKPVSSTAMVKVIKTRFFAGALDAENSQMDKQIQVSAYPATSAGLPPPDAPTDFQMSAYDPATDAFYYMDEIPASVSAGIQVMAPDGITSTVIQPSRVWQSS